MVIFWTRIHGAVGGLGHAQKARLHLVLEPRRGAGGPGAFEGDDLHFKIGEFLGQDIVNLAGESGAFVLAHLLEAGSQSSQFLTGSVDGCSIRFRSVISTTMTAVWPGHGE